MRGLSFTCMREMGGNHRVYRAPPISRWIPEFAGVGPGLRQPRLGDAAPPVHRGGQVEPAQHPAAQRAADRQSHSAATAARNTPSAVSG